MNFFRIIFTGVVSVIMMFGGISTTAQTITVPEGLEYIKLTNNSNVDVAYYFCDSEGGSIYVQHTVDGYEKKSIPQGKEAKVYLNRFLLTSQEDVTLKVIPYRDYQYNYLENGSISDNTLKVGSVNSYVTSSGAICNSSPSIPILGEYSFTLDPNNYESKAFTISGTTSFEQDDIYDLHAYVNKHEIFETIEESASVLVKTFPEDRALNPYHYTYVENFLSDSFCNQTDVFNQRSTSKDSSINPFNFYPHYTTSYTASVSANSNNLYIDITGNECANGVTNALEVYTGELTARALNVFEPIVADTPRTLLNLTLNGDSTLADDNQYEIVLPSSDVNQYCVDGVLSTLNSTTGTVFDYNSKTFSLYTNGVCESFDAYTVEPLRLAINEGVVTGVNYSEQELDTTQLTLSLQTIPSYTLEKVETYVLPDNSYYSILPTPPDYSVCYTESENVIVPLGSKASIWDESNRLLTHESLLDTTSNIKTFYPYNETTEMCETDNFDPFRSDTELNPDIKEFGHVILGYNFVDSLTANELSAMKTLVIDEATDISIAGEAVVASTQITTTELININEACGDPYATIKLGFDTVSQNDIFVSTYVQNEGPNISDTEFQFISCGFASTYADEYGAMNFVYSIPTTEYNNYENFKVYTQNSPWTEMQYTTTTEGNNTIINVSTDGFEGVAITATSIQTNDGNDGNTNTNNTNSNSDTTNDTTNNENTTAGQQNLVRTGGGAVMGIVFGLVALIGFGYVSQRRKEIKADLN